MKTVYKYPLSAPGRMKDTVAVELAEGAQLLTVQLQYGEPYLWALVNTDNQTAPHTIRIAGTGHPLPDDAHHRYLGTVQLAGGGLVFHYFEEVPL